jgi:hypothetical protein
VKFGAIVPEGRRVRAPEYASRKLITIHDPNRMMDGYYIFVGWDQPNGTYSAWLYDDSGKHRHTWSWDYTSLDPDGPSNGSDNPHGFYVLRDGSVIAGFDKGDVMARLDACGKPLWVKPGIYHHSLDAAEDGSLWGWRGEGTAYGHFNHLEQFDPETGKTLKEIELVKDIVKPMRSAAIVFGVRPDFRFAKFEKDPVDQTATDIFHPNDVEPLRSDMARMFPLFEAGDLLISLRNVNLVAVIDPDDYRVKWWSNGPWRAQHDPDFTADGKISVYNNNTGRQRSEIIKMDPMTREVSNDLFGGDAIFYSSAMGRHQYLPNGNVLVVVPGEGRVIEVSHDGHNVMEFNNLSPVSFEYNEHVENGMWVPMDYFDSVPSCVDDTSSR